jgi:hypothetical protein
MSQQERFRFAWTLDGRKVSSIMDMHSECRVLLISPTEKFFGLKFDQFDSIPVQKMKPKPSSWVLQAASHWKKSNDVA